MAQQVVVDNGVVIFITPDIWEPGNPSRGPLSPNTFYWVGEPVKIGDRDPRPEGMRNEYFGLMQMGIALVGSTEIMPYSIQKWLELYGDWLNELHFARFGVYRSQQELVNEWVARMSNTYVPPQ